MGLRAPSPQNLTKRLKFFLKNPHLPNARWEVFNINYQMIIKKFNNKEIDRIEGNRLLAELDRTQGWPEEKKSEMTKLAEKTGLNI